MTAAPSKRSWFAGVTDALRPPPKLTLSEWADKNFVLSAESAAEPGRWKTLAYQRGILNAISDPSVTRVSVMKSARIGYTKCVNAAIGFFIDGDPCPILVVQPTVEDAEGYSKEEIAPMLRDCEVLAGKVKEATAKSSAQTILHKTFPGGVLSMVGANSGRGFRRVSRRVVIFDEVDGYPASAGTEGDPVKLGERRAEYYWNRKIIAGSTPLVAGSSRIEELFEAGDRRRYYVPCPHCGHMDFLRFNLRRDDEDRKAGFVMRWPKDDPSGAHFVCPECGCVIDETSKRTMIEAGEWRAEREFVDHASFHIWAAYSLSPNASWCQIATEFIEAKKRPDTLKTFVNTVLGETWKDLGEAPDWELVKQRRESYPLAKVPDGVVALTCGVDVQKDRFIYEVVGWAPSKESWSVDAGQLHGDTSHPDTWKKLDELLDRVYPSTSGDLSFQIAMMAIDSGYNAQVVYNWVRRKPSSRVIAVKGVSSARVIIGSPTKVDVTVNGKKLRRGTKVWPVGVDIAKGEFYGWLGLRRDAAGEAPPGYCHFPEYGDEFFQQITAEHLVTIVGKRGGRTRMVWSVQANRENHYLDCRVYARAAVNLYGIDRMQSGSSRKITTKVQQLAASLPPVGGSPAPTPVPAPTPQQESIARPTGNKPRTGFWNKGAPRAARPGGWFSKRR